jgi:diguanylate cyclase (GGDEF)-like protein
MNLKAGFLSVITAALLWTAGLIAVQRLPLENSAAQWRLRIVLLLAWFLGLAVLSLLFRGQHLLDSAKSKFHRIADTVDPETGLPSRSSFREIVRKHMDSSGKRDEKGLVVLICIKDLDKIAESHGDDEAEKVMVRVSKALLDSLRGADILGRHDKDELAAFLPKATSLCWETISERIHLNVAAQNDQFEKPYIIAVSTGHCEFDPASPSPMEILLRRAYDEMIKDMGKDQK